MNFKNIKQKFFAAVAASPLVFLAPDIAQAEPFVEYTHKVGTPLTDYKKPRSTEPVTRKIDCGAFYRPPSAPNKIFFTPEVSRQIDIEGAMIGKPVDLNRPEKDVIYDLTQNTQQWFQHLATAHEQCRGQYVNLYKRYKNGATPPDAKPGWESQRHCPHQEVAQMCMSELGIK
jgi:hypothetical protein